MFRQVRLEVLNIMIHFILCIILIAAYVILRIYGIDDEALKMGLIAAITFFFGSTANALSNNTIQKQNDKIIQQITPIAVVPPTEPPIQPPGNNFHA